MRPTAAALALALAAVAEAASRDVFVVTFREAPLAVYRGGLPGLAATCPEVTGQRKLDAKAPDSVAYLAFLEARQARHVADVEAVLGRPLDVSFRYLAAANGVAARLTRDEAAAVAKLPWVEEVVPDHLQPLLTDAGPRFIGAPTIWSGSSTGGVPTKGEGIVVGMLDTGINMDHPSFSDAPPDGYTYVNPNGSGNFIGDCSATYVCNDKLFGVWDFADTATGPEDDHGHGSHTSGTAAGNGLTYPPFTGVAPHASLVSYDVCAGGGCPFSSTLAGINQAILDGADVVSYSIGGGTDPWNGGDMGRYFLNAVAAGIYVSAAAANSGPAAGTLNNVGPWIATTAACTHDRVTPNGHEMGLVSMAGGTPPPDMTGYGMSELAYGPAPIVLAGSYANGDPNPEDCESAFPPGTWSAGEIVQCDSIASTPPLLQAQNVAAGGARAVIIGNVLGSDPIYEHPGVIPMIHLRASDANVLRAWLASGPTHTGTLTATTIVLDPAIADVVASFSSRGPSPFDALKPDVAAPGGGSNGAGWIWAAFKDVPGFTGPNYEAMWGTSMATPHGTGSAALLISLHPTWTPPEIKSAILTTAQPSMRKENGVTPSDPFDRGTGRIDLTKAARAGLVMHETYASFLAADPATGGDPRTLNLPSFQDSRCSGVCGFTRTVRSVASGPVTWTASFTSSPGLALSVTPPTFTITPGATQQLTLSADVTTLPLSQWVFGQITLTPSALGVPSARFPIAVRPFRESTCYVLGQGHGQPNPNEVKVYTGAGASTTVDFFPYGAGQWGTNVASGNIDLGSYGEILTGPGPGAIFGPQVRAFDRAGSPIAKVNYYAYGTLRYGVKTAAADLEGDRYDEIVTGPGPGDVFGPHVRGFNYDGATLSAIAKVSFFAYGTLKFGVNPASGDVDADRFGELLTGPGPGAIFGPQVRGFDYDGTAVAAIAKINFLAFSQPGFGVNVAGGDVEDDGFAEVLASLGPGATGSYPARFLGFDYDAAAIAPAPGFDVTLFASRYGGNVASGDVSADLSDDLLAGAGPDPASYSTVVAATYDGAVLTQRPPFTPFALQAYGVETAAGILGY